MTNKFTTPGEWIVSQENDGRICVKAMTERGSRIIAVTGMVGGDDENEAIANAALMACAGPMLETLVAIQDALTAKMIDVDAMLEMIVGQQGVFAKLANEAGEE